MNEMGTAMNIGRIENAMARSRIYALLATGFRYPDADCFTRLSDGTYLEVMTGALDICAADSAVDLRAGLAAGLQAVSSREELESAYLSAFETNLPDPSVSLYEGSHHLQGNKPGLLLELKGFYRTFGLSMAGSENDLEDALSAEFEFMQFLTAKQVQAEEGALDKAPYLRAQLDFLKRHLAAWLPGLQAEAEGKLKHPFYRALTALANGFVVLDTKALERELASFDAWRSTGSCGDQP